jgi:hypothetical protein
MLALAPSAVRAKLRLFDSMRSAESARSRRFANNGGCADATFGRLETLSFRTLLDRRRCSSRYGTGFSREVDPAASFALVFKFSALRLPRRLFCLPSVDGRRVCAVDRASCDRSTDSGLAVSWREGGAAVFRSPSWTHQSPLKQRSTRRLVVGSMSRISGLDRSDSRARTI